jgi:hypothetical protein
MFDEYEELQRGATEEKYALLVCYIYFVYEVISELKDKISDSFFLFSLSIQLININSIIFLRHDRAGKEYIPLSHCLV